MTWSPGIKTGWLSLISNGDADDGMEIGGNDKSTGSRVRRKPAASAETLVEDFSVVFAIDWEMEGDYLAEVLGASVSKEQLQEWEKKGWL